VTASSEAATGESTGAASGRPNYVWPTAGCGARLARFRRRVGLAWSKHHCRARHLGPEVAAELNPAVHILSLSDGCSVLDLEQPSTLT
jgi:hypothetical protein